MRVLLALDATATSPGSVEDSARRAERAGYSGISLPELAHDPVPLIALASRATERIQLATGVLIAFARNPMTVATTAADLQEISRGRFILGLGSQVRPHIERRFSMPWSAPADRMRDFVLALRDIWSSFVTGERLNHRGEHYRHTLLTPMFSPGAMPYGQPPVWIAGVGERMTAVAGEVGDGYVAHAFSSSEFLREVTLSALREGAERAGRDLPDVVATPMVAVGDTAEERAEALAHIRSQLAFYASTPSYRAVMELHGWEQTADRLSGLARRQEWTAMAELFDDDMLRAFALVGTPDEVAAEAVRRYGGLADALSLGVPHGTSASAQERLLAALR